MYRIHYPLQGTGSQYLETNNLSAKNSRAFVLFSDKAEVTSWAQLMRKAHRCAIVQHPVIVQEKLLRLSACSMTWSYTKSRFYVVMSKHLHEGWRHRHQSMPGQFRLASVL